MAYLDYDGLSEVRNLIDNLYVRVDEFQDDVRERINWELDPIDGTVKLRTSIAADETTKTAWEGASSETVEVITPDRFTGLALLLYIKILIGHRVNLVWMNGSELEFSTLQARIDTQTNAVIVYARGRSSMAYGVAGVDDSWTITALPDDTPYELPPATASTLGGVKVGTGLSVATDGTLSVPGLTVLEYGKSTWADFQAAYNANKLVYCRYKMSANEVRMAFLAYTFPGKAEFQYYRTVGTKSDTQQGDEVYIYTLVKTKSAWTTTVRQNYAKIVAGTGLTSTYTYSASTNAGTLTLNSAPNKLGFGYGHCTTAAATAAKTVAISDYTLTTGGIVTVLFDNDVQAGATLNVTSKGAKAIYHKGAAITNGVIKAGDTATFIYSGQYHLVGIDHDAYTLPTATTSTLGGVIVGDGLSVAADGTLSASGGGSVTMEDTEVDAAVEAAWPAPTGYAITPDQTYITMGHLLAIGLSDEVESGEFVATAGEGETVYVMSDSGDWQPQVSIDSTSAIVAYALYGQGTSGTLYTFTMPAEAVTVSMWYND